MADRFTADQYAQANQWASGKDATTIFNKASELGLSADELGRVFGDNGGSGAQVTALTGYGSGAPLGGQLSNGTSLSDWSYDASTPGGWSQAKKPLPPPGAGGRSDGQNPYRYDQQNPYLSQMAQSIGSQISDNVQRNIMPNVRSGAQQAGGYGGSRQGVVEANVYNDANKSFSDAVTNLYSTDYNNQLNRQMQQYQTDSNFDVSQGQLALGNKQADNTYNLGLSNLQLGRDTLGQNLNIANMQNDTTRYGLDTNSATSRYNTDTNAATSRYGTDKSYDVGMANVGANATASANNYNLGMTNANNSFYTNQRQLDQSGYRLGMDMMNSANTGYMNQGSGMYDTGSAYQTAPWATVGAFNNATTPYTGFGATASTSQNSNPWAQALGGATMGAQVGKLFSGSSGMGDIVNSGGVSGLPSSYLTGW